jgi:hypothetical protein
MESSDDPEDARWAAGLLRDRCRVVFATVCGLLVGAGPINVFAIGVFLKPITEDLGLRAATAALSETRFVLILLAGASTGYRVPTSRPPSSSCR